MIKHLLVELRDDIGINGLKTVIEEISRLSSVENVTIENICPDPDLGYKQPRYPRQWGTTNVDTSGLLK